MRITRKSKNTNIFRILNYIVKFLCGTVISFCISTMRESIFQPFARLNAILKTFANLVEDNDMLLPLACL